MGRWETNFVLSQDAAKRFERFTEANIGNRLAIVLDKMVLSAPTIQNKISDTGPDYRRGESGGSGRSGAEPARRFAAGERRVSRGTQRRARRWAPIPSATGFIRAWPA